jgi:hypothetical protein
MAVGNGRREEVSWILLLPCLPPPNLMPPVSNPRSPAQESHTAWLSDSRAAQRHSFAVVKDEQDQILQLKDEAKDLRRIIRNERKCSKRAKAARLKDIKGREDKENSPRTPSKPRNEEAEKSKSRERFTEMERQLEREKKKVRALNKKVVRFPEQKKRAIQGALCRAKLLNHGSWLRIKTKSGRISTPARRIIRELVLRHKVSTSQAGGVLCTVTNAGPNEVVSRRSSGRIVGEVGVGNKLRVAGEVSKAVGEYALKRQGMWLTKTNSIAITISSDGTTNRDIPWESRHIYVRESMETTPMKLSLGPGRAANHTSESQAAGWRNEWAEALSAYNRSPLGQETKVNPLDFGRKLTGMVTDHAPDQLKLARLLREWKIECDREMRGYQAVLSVPVDDLVAMVSEENEKMTKKAGGLKAWSQLAPQVRDELVGEVLRQSRIRLGEQVYQALSEEDKRLADLFIWTGCSMHKDLNAVKGGYKRLITVWLKPDVLPPINLLNKDKVAAACLANANAELPIPVEACPDRGAIKLTRLVGALVNHKDDKKGYHDLFRHFCHAVICREVNFPDTSNTRYQCYCNAATELITNRALYIEFVAFLEYSKTTPGLNHLEQNILAGLDDLPTQTELAVLSLYSQAISIPYIRHVRGSPTTNHLDLAPFHDRLKQHCRAVIENPGILIGPEVHYGTATLDSQPWQDGAAIDIILQSRNNLPNLQDALVLFFEGALETWEQFTPEFQPGSDAMLATPKERTRAWRPSTNDDNESGCARVRTLLRVAPNMTELQLKARVVGEVNKTDRWMAETLDEDADIGRFIRTETRRLDESKHHQKQNTESVEAKIQRSKGTREKKEKREEEMRKKKAELKRLLEGFKPDLDPAHLRDMGQKGDTIARMKLQLLWHRGVGKDSQVPEHLSKLKLWTDVREKVVEAVERHLKAGVGSITVRVCVLWVYIFKLTYQLIG